jgi:hypothetical protein
MVSYLAFRLLVDFLKPDRQFSGLSAIQWTAFGALIYYAYIARRAHRPLAIDQDRVERA